MSLEALSNNRQSSECQLLSLRFLVVQISWLCLWLLLGLGTLSWREGYCFITLGCYSVVPSFWFDRGRRCSYLWKSVWSPANYWPITVCSCNPTVSSDFRVAFSSGFRLGLCARGSCGWRYCLSSLIWLMFQRPSCHLWAAGIFIRSNLLYQSLYLSNSRHHSPTLSTNYS